MAKIFEVILASKAKKEFGKIPSRYKDKVALVLLELRHNPYLGKKLSGKLKNLYSLKVWPYRVIYQIVKRDLVVLVIRVGHRQYIYNM